MLGVHPFGVAEVGVGELWIRHKSGECCGEAFFVSLYLRSGQLYARWTFSPKDARWRSITSKSPSPEG